MFKKFATFQITSAVLVSEGMSRTAARQITAHRAVFEYEPRPGYLYVRSRAISSRCNDNFDEFPAEEIKKAYRTFIGKPVFVNHNNDNHRRARGVIIDAALHEDRNPDGSPDTWAEVLMEVDAVRFPKLAEAIIAREIDRTSMGTDVAYSVCSVCNNKASSPTEYCAHIPRMKGQRIYRTTASGQKEGVLVRERCYGLGFFENSLLVEEPADPTAYFLGVDDRGVRGKTASLTKTADEDQCPTCSDSGLPIGGGLYRCQGCGADFHLGEGDVPSRLASKEYPRLDGVGLKQDDKGWYVHTHRARSKSYESPEAIPDKDVEFIRSTGSKTAGEVIDMAEQRGKRVCPECEGDGGDYDGYYACDGCGGDGTLKAYNERQSKQSSKTASWSQARHSDPIIHVMGQPAPRPLQTGDSVMHPESGYTDKIVGHAPSLLMFQQSGVMHRGPIEGDHSKTIFSSDTYDEAGKDVPQMTDEQRRYMDSNQTGPTKYSSKTAASIPLSPDDHEFYRQMHDQAQTAQEMDAHARTRPVNLGDPADLKSHLFEAHGWDENDLWRNSHPEDHPAMMGATDEDRPLTHEELRGAHEHEHNVEYPEDYPNAITLGDSHFHTAAKRTASWIGDHPDEPTLHWRAPKSGWEVHIENHTPDRDLRDNYGAKPSQGVILYHADQIAPRHPNAPAHMAPRGGWSYERNSNTGEHRYNPNTWGAVVPHIPAHVQKQVDNAQAAVDKHAEDHANLYGGLAEHQDMQNDFSRAERDHQARQRWQEQFATTGRECTWCHGSGKAVDGINECPGCDGSGRHTASRRTAGYLNDKPTGRRTEFWASPKGDAPYDAFSAAHGIAPKEEGHGPWHLTRDPKTRAYNVVDNQNRSISTHKDPGNPHYDLSDHNAWRHANEVWQKVNHAHGHQDEEHIDNAWDRAPAPPFEHSTEDPKVAEFKQRAKDHPAERILPPKVVQESSSREHGTTYREARPEEYDSPKAFHDSSPEDGWHGPYRVIQHAQTNKFHVVDNANRVTQYGGRKGMDEQHTAEMMRDYADGRQASKEKAKGIAEKLFGDTMNILDPGGTDESRRSDRHTDRLNSLMHRYEGGNHHPLSPGKFGYDDHEKEGDEEGEPYYEVHDPSGSGFSARDYGGANVHIHHQAMDHAVDLVDAGDPETRNKGWQQEKSPGFGHDELHQTLKHWMHGDPADGEDAYGAAKDHADNEPAIKRWQRRKGYTAMKRTAFGETKAPADVDTLRDEECPVCGESDSYDGNSCQVCGFDAPPQMFRDPNLDMAKQVDLRKDNLEEAGALPGQDGLDPTQQDLNGGLPGEIPGDAVPGTDQVPLGPDGQPLDPQVPVDPSQVNADGTVMPAVDPSIILQQQMDQLQSGVPLTPDQLGPNGEIGVGGMDPQLDSDAATGHFDQGGEPFTPGPNAPMPEDPMQPGGQVGGPMDDTVDPDALDEQGQPIQEPGAGDPGTPADGTPDLVCPACGFEADAQQPTSVDMDTQAVPADGGMDDGTLAGDVCPNCGQAAMTSVGEMEQAQQGLPV